MNQVPDCIGQLLKRHNCVIVPGLGGFVANYQSAKMHPTSYIFNCPTKGLAFNINLKNNDGLLTNTVASLSQVSMAEAETMVSDYVMQVQEMLQEKKPVKIPGIGRLLTDIENKVQFIPDNSRNYLLQSYGLYSLTAQPVLRDKTAAIKHIDKGNVQKSRPRRRWKFLLPLAAVILLSLVTAQIFFQTKMQGFDYAEVIGLNRISSTNESVHALKYRNTDYMFSPAILALREPETVKGPAQTPDAVQDESNTNSVADNVPAESTNSFNAKYILVAGVYGQSRNLEKVMDHIRTSGYDSQIMPRGKYQMIAVQIPEGMGVREFRAQFISATAIRDAWILALR